MKPIRVLMVVRLFYPWIGGAERQAHKLAKKLVEKGIDVQIVTGWWFRQTRQRETIDGISIFRNHTMWHMFDFKGLRKFGGFLYIVTLWWHLWRRKRDYDVIHVHSLGYHAFAAVLSGRWLKRKTLTKLANSGLASDIKKMRLNKRLPFTRYMLPTALKCDCFVATNPMIAKELGTEGVPPTRIVRLPNGIDTNSVVPKSSYALHNPIRLVFIGRLHEQKGVDVLLTAFEHVVEQHPTANLTLNVLGDGPLRDTLRTQAQQLGIAQRVTFVGQSDLVHQYLSQADIFILPSRAEGISNALLEAMACALPIVATRIPGNSDVIEHGRNGLLFTVDDPGSLTHAIMSLVLDADLRQRLGVAARQTAEDQFSLSFVADRYVSLYRDLLSTPRRHFVTNERQPVH